MNQKFAVIGIIALTLFGCLGEDSQVETDHENTRGYCVDGDDNDGDGHYDCYDPDCYRVNDSLMFYKQDTICHYEDYRATVLPSSSSMSSSVAPSSSSSSVVSSSSQAPATFPLVVAEDADDSIQIFALYRKPGSAEIAYAGRMLTYGLMGVIDTSGAILKIAEGISNPPTEAVFSGSKGPAISMTYTSLDTNFDGYLRAVGTAYYNNGSIANATTFVTSDNSRSHYYLPHDNFVFWGNNTSTSACWVSNSNGASYVMVDQNLTNDTLPSYTNKLPSSTMIQGELIGNKCAGIGTRTTTSPDSSQIWLMVTSQGNLKEQQVQITTGTSATEVAADMEVYNGKIYVAATVAGQARLLVLDDDYTTLDNAGTDRGPGKPWRVKIITLEGSDNVLMVGELAGAGALWLFNTTGALVDEATLAATDAKALTDVIQLDDGTLVVSGWKATSSTGTQGVILKVDPATLTVID